MKKFRLSVAILLSVWSLAGMGGANAQSGSGIGGVQVEKSDKKKVRLYTQSGKSVDVAIMDADGNVLYRDISSKKSTTSFNLGKLPDGQYYLTAGNDAWWMSQGLTIKDNTLNVDSRNLQEIAAPTLTAYGQNKIEVVLPGQNVNEANVSIYDAQNVLVESATFSGKSGRFDLSNLPDGAYTFVVGPNQKQFSSLVSVRH